jgi:type II restriction enzyme
MPKFKTLSATATKRRASWIDEIVKISGHFGQDSSRIEAELTSEIKVDKTTALLDHLHLCGAIPERYGHDSSEEKLYSKYTDALLAATLRHLGLTASVLTERADAADVEAVGKDFALVADAKVFRLSRTAKNQKDFKIEAMHGWKRGKPHAIVVCPIYQLPTRTSQIYQQSIARNVCIFSYAHMAVLVRLADEAGKGSAEALLLKVLKCAEELNPTKDSVAYWTCINRTMLNHHKKVPELWGIEKLATLESIVAAKEEALTFLAREREEIMRMTREEAIKFLIADRNIDGRTKVVKAVGDNGILAIPAEPITVADLA